MLGFGNTIMLSALISVLFFLITLLIYLFSGKELIFKDWIKLILSLITVFGISCVGSIIHDTHCYKNYMYQFEIEKQMIENSMCNEKLSGFERIELVKQATESNKELAKYKYDCQQWYGIAIPDEIMYIEFISLD